MMSFEVYTLLMTLSWLLLIVSTVSLIVSLSVSRHHISSAWHGRISIKDNREDPVVKRGLRNRKIWRALSVLGILVGATFPVLAPITGEAEAQHQQRVEEVRELAQKFFIDEVSFQQAEGLLADGATMKVVSSDGSTQELEFNYVERLFLNPAIYAMETAGDYEAGRGVWFTAEEQNGWLLRKTVSDSVQARYGIELNPEQIEALKIPTEVPATLTRYGTVPLTIAVDGGYLNADATLIWDGDFKLVGIPGAQQELLELPVVPSGSDR